MKVSITAGVCLAAGVSLCHGFTAAPSMGHTTQRTDSSSSRSSRGATTTMSMGMGSGSGRSSSTGAFVAPLTGRNAWCSSSYGSRSSRAGRCTAAAALSMLVSPKGEDSFKEFAGDNEANVVRKTLSGMSRNMAKVVTTGVVPAAALLGAVIAPGGAVVSVVGGAISGGAATTARKRLIQERKSAAPANVAQLLDEQGFANVTPEDIQGVFDQFDLDEEEQGAILEDIYKRFVVSQCRDSTPTTAEIQELKTLKMSLGLDGGMVGNALTEAAEEIYEERTANTDPADLLDPYNLDRMALNKFLFLADRVMRTTDTKEAYDFEMSRIRKAFFMSASEVNKRLTDVATPFYLTALSKVNQNLGKITPEALKKAQTSLGLSNDARDNLHRDAFRAEIKKLLSANEPKAFMEGDKERLQQMAKVLGIDKADSVGYIRKITEPLFEFRAEAIVAEDFIEHGATRESAAEYVEGLLEQLDGLELEVATGRDILSDEVVGLLRGITEQALTYSQVDNTKKAKEVFMEEIPFIQGTDAILAKLEEKVMDEAAKKKTLIDKKNVAARKAMLDKVGGGLNTVLEGGPAIDEESVFRDVGSEDCEKLYERVLVTFLGHDLTEEEETVLALIGTLLGLDQDDRDEIFQENTEPKLRQQVLDSTAKAMETGEFSDEAQAENLALLAKLGIDPEVYELMTVEAYERELKKRVKKGHVMTDKESQQLKQLATFLQIPQEEVDKAHKILCAPVYRQSILEAFGATGIVPPDVRATLRALRMRLGINEEDAKQLFFKAVGVRMKDMVKSLFYEFERSVLSKKELGKVRGADQGDDPLVKGSSSLGIESDVAVTSEALNLIDFYMANGVAQLKPKPKKKTKEGEEEEETGPDEYEYPVNCRDYDEPEPAKREKMYESFVISSFTVTGRDASRYSAEKQGHLAGILGIAPATVQRIQEEIGTKAVEQYLKNALSKAPQLSPQDIAYLAQIQTRLHVSEAEFEDICMKVKKQIVEARQVEVLNTDKPNPQAVLALRSLINNLGMDMATELDVEERQLLFTAELEPGVESGSVFEDEEMVADIRDAYGLEDEEANNAIMTMLEDRTRTALDDLTTGAKLQEAGKLLGAVDRILNYVELAGGELPAENFMDDQDRDRVMAMYKTAVDGQGDTPEEEKAVQEKIVALYDAIREPTARERADKADAKWKPEVETGSGGP